MIRNTERPPTGVQKTVLGLADGIPILMRLINGKRFEPGPFNLGRFGPFLGSVAVLWVVFITVRTPLERHCASVACATCECTLRHSGSQEKDVKNLQWRDGASLRGPSLLSHTADQAVKDFALPGCCHRSAESGCRTLLRVPGARSGIHLVTQEATQSGLTHVCCVVQAAFVLPQTFPVTSKTLNYSGVAVGIATLAAIFFWFLPGGLGARYWYRGKIETARIGFDSVRAPPVVSRGIARFPFFDGMLCMGVTHLPAACMHVLDEPPWTQPSNVWQ